jgi:hypothetical protein
MQKLEELIAALESATGPSRWLDAKIDAAMRVGTVKMQSGGYEWAWNNFPVWAHHKQAQGMCGVQHSNGDLGLIWDSLPFTSSIDAAVALVERVLPGWRIENLCEWDAEILRDQGPWMCDLVQRRLEFFDRQSAKCSHAPTAALALIIALLKAKLSQEKSL